MTGRLLMFETAPKWLQIAAKALLWLTNIKSYISFKCDLEFVMTFEGQNEQKEHKMVVSRD